MGDFFGDRTPVVVIDGSITTVPAISNRRQITTVEIIQHLESALSSNYDGVDPKKFGLTKAEAAFLSLAEQAQDGNSDALEVLLNRLMGKPMQQINSLTVTASLSEFLGGLAAELVKTEPFIEVEAEVDPLGD